MVDVNIPPGYGIPLANLTTGLLPDRTMDALDARYSGGIGDTAFEWIQTTPLATWTIPVPGAMNRRDRKSVV